jgi:AcrR family transcriptional regulator
MPIGSAEMTAHDTSARPLRRDALRNHELVLDAAREVISEFGTEASMELVASRAGVGVGTVYRRFPNKEALIDELVRIILDELITAARDALAQENGSGLEAFLRTCGHSFASHRGYSDKLMSNVKSSYAEVLFGLMTELLAQAKQHGTIGPDVTIADIRATTWAIRGIIQTTGAVAPLAWERHLDIHLAGLRAAILPSTRPSLDATQLGLISGHPTGER